jgi:hypothetical protein
VDTKVMNTIQNQNPYPGARTSGSQNPVPQKFTSPQPQNAASPVYTPVRPPASTGVVPAGSQPHPVTPQGYPLGRPYPDSPQPVVPVRQSQAQPVFNVEPQTRSVEERHQAYKLAQEALHDRHYEDNNFRTAAEIALAEFFLA